MKSVPNFLRPRPIRQGVLALCAVLSVPAVHAEEQVLDAVQVVGRGEGQAYYADEGEVGRTDTPLREVPQSIRIVPRQVIDDIGAVRLEEAYDFVSGVSRQNSFGGMWDNFSIRGFSGDINTGPNFLRNGFAGNRGFNAPRDTANVERIEVLKGPASALYGGSEPGGVLNVVTKKPQFKPGHSVELYAGSYDTYRTLFDSTGPITDTFAYRLNLAHEDKGGFRDHVGSKRYLLAPSFSWLLAPDTFLNYDLEVLRHKAPFDRGVVAVGGRTGSMSREAFLGEPGDGDITIDNHTHQLTLEHAFSLDWRAKVGLSWRTTALEGYSTEVRPSNPLLFVPVGSRNINRERRYRNYDSRDLAFQGEIHGKFTTGGVGHELLAGLDSYRFSLDSVTMRVRPGNYSIDIDHPVYGQPLPTPVSNTDSLERQRATGVFMQDQISLAEDWRLLLGVRHDRFHQRVHNRRTDTRSIQDHSVTTPRVGLTWLLAPTLSTYVLASESFRPNSGIDAAGAAFSPERGRAKEIGLKFEAPDQGFGATLAVFEIDKKNVLTRDPGNPDFSVAAGEARSRGVEIDLAGQLTDRIRITANYAFIDAEITKDNNPALRGAPLLNVPRNSGSALLMYEDGFAGGRFGIGAGATYVGRRSGNAAESFQLPAYAVARAMAYWKPSDTLRFSLDIDNLFDKTYYASSYDVYWITPGNPRTITLGMQTRF